MIILLQAAKLQEIQVLYSTGFKKIFGTKLIRITSDFGKKRQRFILE
jgi:hypothetical protein